VIFMRRNLEEVVASQDVMLSRRGRESGDLSKEKLIGLFQQQLAQFEGWVARQPNFRILYVSYNDVLKTPDDAVRQVNEFLGSQLNVKAMRAIVEPSLYRQRAE